MRFIQDENGQSVVVVALFIGIVGIGFLGLALDSGNLMREKRMAQSAADAAAVAAAEEVYSGNSANEIPVAQAVAKMNGFDTTLPVNPATVTFPTPPSGFTGSVSVTVSQPIRNLFMGAFSSNLATQIVSATGTAGGAQVSQTCVCLTGTSGQTLTMSNNATLNANSCGVVDNSGDSNGVGMSGGSHLNATSLGLYSSAWASASNLTNGASTGSTTIVPGVNRCSPSLPPAPTGYGACLADPGGSYGTFTWGPASSSGSVCYQSLTVGANGSTCTLNPGVYVITGTLHFESGANGHSNLGGNGVFFYLTGSASLVIDNGANLNVVSGSGSQLGGGTAPSLGAYDGIVLYQATGDTSTVNIQGGSNTYVNGALYAPSAAMNLANGSQMTYPIGGIVASSLNMAGGGTLNITNTAPEGSITIGNAKLVQ